MALVSGRSSSLNPNAPLFIPTAFRQVEDFSPQWWELVETSTWFRDYWLSQHKEDDFGESANDTTNDDIANLPQELCDLFVDDDFDYLENELEQLVLFSEAQESAAHADSNNGKLVVDDVHKDAKAILKQLKVPKSPKERGPKSPAALAKCHEKPAQRVNLKCASRRIHQIHQPR